MVVPKAYAVLHAPPLRIVCIGQVRPAFAFDQVPRAVGQKTTGIEFPVTRKPGTNPLDFATILRANSRVSD